MGRYHAVAGVISICTKIVCGEVQGSRKERHNCKGVASNKGNLQRDKGAVCILLAATNVGKRNMLTCPSKFIQPTRYEAKGPYFCPTTNAQKYNPPETGKHDDNSAMDSPTMTVKMPVRIQLHNNTTGPPYSKH